VPSKSGKQHRLMALVANNPAAAKRLNIPQSVGKEYMKADKRKGKKYALGGPTSYSGEDDSDQGMKMSTRRGGDRGSAKTMTDEERYGKIGAEIRRLDPEAFKNRSDKSAAGNLKLLKELREKKSQSSKTEVPAESSVTSAASIPTGPRSGGRGSKPGMARVGSGRYDDPTSSFGERVTSPFRKLTDIFGRREEEDVMRNMNVSRDEARKRLDARKAATGMRGGGSIKKYRGGGSVSSASKRADGIAQKGKTRGKIC
jgi:hypothetical protein